MAYQKVSGDNTQGEKAVWIEESRKQCFCNTTSSCCSCHCCAMFILVVWVIVAAIAIAGSAIMLNEIESNWETFKPCIGDSSLSECCATQNSDGGVSYITLDASCDTIKAVQTAGIVTSGIQMVASIAGIIGICSFVAWLLLVPLGYSICIIIVNIIYMAVMGFDYYGYWPSVVFSALIVYLFYMNHKIMKAAQN
eukprot:811909_1